MLKHRKFKSYTYHIQTLFEIGMFLIIKNLVIRDFTNYALALLHEERIVIPQFTSLFRHLFLEIFKFILGALDFAHEAIHSCFCVV